MKKILHLIFGRFFVVAMAIILQVLWLCVVLWQLSYKFTYVNLLVRVIAIIVVLVIVNKWTNPANKLSWTFLILLSPIFGLMVYFLFGRSGLTKHTRERMDAVNRQVEALFQGMDGMISSKTVVGDAIHVGDTIILPLVDVSFGIGAGSFRAEKREKGMGGIGGKITPSAVLVIKNGTTKLVNVRNQDTMTKILDMVPDLVDRFTEKKEDKVTEADVAEILDSAEKEENV